MSLPSPALLPCSDAFRRRSLSGESSRSESELCVACAARLAVLDAESRAAPLVAVATVDGVGSVTIILELDEREPGLQSDVNQTTVLLEQTLDMRADTEATGRGGGGGRQGQRRARFEFVCPLPLLQSRPLPPQCRPSIDLDILGGGVARASDVESSSSRRSAISASEGRRRRAAIAARRTAVAATITATIAAAATTIVVAWKRGEKQEGEEERCKQWCILV